MRIGYVRVSTADQNTARQLVGVEVEKMFTDHATGKNQERPALDAALGFLREGDELFVHSMDRLARNLTDLLALVDSLTTKGVTVTFIHEHLTFTGDDSPMSRLLLSVMGSVAEFERAHARERQAEGIAAAKARGVYKGRKPALTRAQALEIAARVKAGETKAALAREYGVSRDALYRNLNLAAV